MAYYLTHTGAELDAAIDRIQAQTKLSAITLTESNITTAGSAFSVTPGAKYTEAGESLAINLGNDLKSTLIASNIKSGVSILGVAGTYSAIVDQETIGSNITRTIYTDGTTVVLGTGTIWDTYFVPYNIKSVPTTLVFDNRVTAIGTLAFDQCSNLTSVSLPSALTTIKSNAFSRCGLTSIDVPSGVTSIGNNAFSQCGDLVSANLPSGLTSIGTEAFKYCTDLALTSLPSGITYIGKSAFESCSSLALTSLPSGITFFGESAFAYCTSLALTTLPSNFTYVSASAFRYCTSLTTMTIPSGVSTINSLAFAYCTGLTSVTFEGTPTTIASGTNTNAFKGCTNLADIYVPWASGAVSGAPWGATNATIHYNTTT